MYRARKLGTLLGQLHPQNFPSLAPKAQEFVFADLSGRLDMSEFTDIAHLVNYHTYGDEKMFERLRANFGDYDEDNGSNGNITCSSIANPCTEVGTTNGSCVDYCRFIGNVSQREEVIKEIFELSFPRYNST